MRPEPQHRSSDFRTLNFSWTTELVGRLRGGSGFGQRCPRSGKFVVINQSKCISKAVADPGQYLRMVRPLRPAQLMVMMSMHGFRWELVLVHHFGKDAVGYFWLDSQGAPWEARLAQVWFCLVAECMEWPGKATCCRVKQGIFHLVADLENISGREGEKINSG